MCFHTHWIKTAGKIIHKDKEEKNKNEMHTDLGNLFETIQSSSSASYAVHMKTISLRFTCLIIKCSHFEERKKKEFPCWSFMKCMTDLSLTTRLRINLFAFYSSGMSLWTFVTNNTCHFVDQASFRCTVDLIYLSQLCKCEHIFHIYAKTKINLYQYKSIKTILASYPVYV